MPAACARDSDFFRMVSGSMLRFALFCKTGNAVSRDSDGAPLLGGNNQISISYGSNAAFCVYSTISRQKIGLDAESLASDPNELAAMGVFLERVFSLSGKKTFRTWQKSACARLWTIYEAFYKLLADKMFLIDLLRANFPIFLRRRSGIAVYGDKTYYFHSLPLKGHWLSMTSEDARLLSAGEFDLEWLTMRDFLQLSGSPPNDLERHP